MSTENQKYETDVLVVGGGFAGAMAALRAAEAGAKVLLVDKGKVAQSGNSPVSGCFIQCPTDADDLDKWVEEIVLRGDYMNDQDWVRIMLEDTVKMIKEIDTWGPVLEKDAKGNLNRFIGRAHITTRIINMDAYQVMHILRKKMEAKGVVIRDRAMITDLLTEDGDHPTRSRVVGAVGLDSRTAEPLTFKAKAVVIGTGSTGLFGGDMVCLSGDGHGIGFRAGAEITGMEYIRWWGEWTFEKKCQAGHMNPWQALRVAFTNTNGDRFFDKYFPELQERVREQDLGAAIGKEVLEARGPIYADFRFASGADWDWIRKSAPNRHVIRTLELAGFNLSKDRLRYDLVTGWMWCLSSGIRNNIYTETNIPGLFAVGQAGGYPTHGTYSVGGVNIATCFISGARAGIFSAKYVKNCPDVTVDKNQVKQLHDVALQPLKVKRGIKGQELRERAGKFLSQAKLSFFFNDRILRTKLDGIRGFQALLPEVRAENPHELIKANSIENWLKCAELAVVASLERKEARGPLLRTDYPYMDNVNWLKRIVQVRGDEGEIVNKIVPIPIHRYPVKPKFEKIPYYFPMPKI